MGGMEDGESLAATAPQLSWQSVKREGPKQGPWGCCCLQEPVRTDLIQMPEKSTANSRGASSPPSARKLLTSLTPASDKARGIRCLAQSHTTSWMQSQDWSPALPDSKPNAFPQSQVGSAYLQQSPGSGLGLLPFGWDDPLMVSTHLSRTSAFKHF